MFGHLRVKSAWSQLALFLGLFGGSFIVYGVISFGVAVSRGWVQGGVSHIDLTNPATLHTMKWLQGLSSIIIFMLPAFIWSLIVFNGKPMRLLGLKPAERPSLYLVAIACILAAFPFVFLLGQLNQAIPLPAWMIEMEDAAADQMEAFLKANGPAGVLINVFLIGLLPAIGEELCFRGALQRIIIQMTRNPWVGIVVTAFLFSALHMQFQGFLPRMFLGVVLGALYWFSGSLWTSIVAHFTNNAVQVIAVSYAPKYVNENPSMPVYVGILSGLIVFLILGYVQKRSSVRYSNVYETNLADGSNQYIS